MTVSLSQRKRFRQGKRNFLSWSILCNKYDQCLLEFVNIHVVSCCFLIISVIIYDHILFPYMQNEQMLYFTSVFP